MAAKKAPKAKPEPDAAELAVHESLRQAQRIWSSGIGTTLGVLKEADQNLSDRLHAIVAKSGGPTGTFTEANATVYRKQIGLVTEYLEKRLTGVTHASAMKALKVSVADTVHLARTFEHKFTGITRPLALESQQMQDAAIRGPGASLLQRHQASWNRYGKAMVSDFERVLRTSQLEGLTHHQTVSRLVEAGKLGGHSAASLHANEPGYFPEPTSYVKRRYWAERIVRTENQHALNAGALQAMNITRQTEFPDLQKKILAVFDNRTAPDSIAVHGQVRKLEEMFMDGAGRQYLHPPARPNDREHIIPWRPHWEHTPATQPAPTEVQAQAVVDAQPTPLGEKRKGELGAALQKAKEKVLAQKAQAQAVKQQAQDFALAQAKAAAAQAEGGQLLGAAKLADEAALKAAAEKVKHVEVPGAKFSAAKAKAQEYLAQKKAIAEAKAAARAAEAQARVVAEAKQKAEGFAQPDMFGGHKEVTDTLKVLAKSKPKVFAELYSQVTGKPAESVVGKLGNPLQLGNLTKQLGKKLQPQLDWPKPKVKAPPPLTLEQKKATLLGPNVDLKAAAAAFTKEEIGLLLKGNPLVLPGEADEILAMSDTGKGAYLHQVAGDWEKLKTQAASAELKDEPHAGKHYVDVYEGGKKVAFYFKEGTAEAPVFAVSPPPAMHNTHPPLKFTAQVEATAYALEVGKQLAQETAAKAAEQAAASLAAKKAGAASAPKAMQPGHGYAADVRTWSGDWQGPTRPAADVKTPVAKQVAQRLEPNRSGVGVLVDEDYIENFNVTFTEEKVNERLEVVARFKVTDHRGKEVRQRLAEAGARSVDYGYKRKASLETQALEYANTKVEQRPSGAQAIELQRKGGVKVTMLESIEKGGTDIAAAHNLVEVRFAKPQKDEDIFSRAQEGFDLLGIGTGAPAAASREAFKRAKIMAYADPDSARELRELKVRSPAAVQGVWEKSVKRNPRLAEIEADAEIREVSPGHTALYSKKLSRDLEDAGVKWLSHTTNKDADVVEMMLQRPEDGILSSRERFQRGLFFTGQSTGRDFETGGADNAFLRVHTSEPTHLVKGDVKYERWVFQVDPSEAGRLDAYFNNEDNFGKVGDHFTRKTVAEMTDLARRNALQGDNELMLQREVPRGSIRRVVARDNTDREALLGRLRKRGLTEINGVPLEDFVVLKGK